MSKKRRANGEGSLRKRSSGSWELTVRVGYKDDGKPDFKRFYGQTQKEVKEKYAAYQSTLKWRREKLPTTFLPLSDLWYERHRKKVTPTTYEGYRYTLKILQDYFKDIEVEKILPMDVEDFLESLADEGRSQSGIAGCRAMMHQIMGLAVANGLIDRNPVRYAEKMHYEDSGTRRDAFSDEEVRLLMEQLPQNKIGMSIRLMLFTSLRMQEILALEPRHISEDGSKLYVEQAVKLIKGTVVVGETKTKSSVREIHVPENVRYCAIALRKTDKKFIWEAGKPNYPCNPSHFRKLFKSAVASVSGVRVLTPHSCRHTFVSMMRSNEIDIAVLKAFTGHAQTKMVDHYTHVRDSECKAASAKLAAAFPLDKPSDTE